MPVPKKHFYQPRKRTAPEDKITPRMKELAAEALDNQLKSNDPPFVSETLERLTAAGLSVGRAKEKMCSVLARHLYTVMHDKKQFSEGRYHMDLDKLK